VLLLSTEKHSMPAHSVKLVSRVVDAEAIVLFRENILVSFERADADDDACDDVDGT
jgi:hypothetical protein